MSKKARAPISAKKYLGIWVPVLVVLAVLILVVNLAIATFDRWIASQLGEGTYTVTNSEKAANWDTNYVAADYPDAKAVDAAAEALVETIEGEGIVLAKNADAALPLPRGARITMLGRAAADPVYGGSGSGSVDVTTAINARTGLENAGFQVNDVAFQAIADFVGQEGNERSNIVMDKPEESTYTIGEMPIANYNAIESSFADYNDAAVVFIGRGGGEGGDLTTNMEGWDPNYEPGQHQLELNKDEKDLLALATSRFDTVIVVVNASTTMEMGPIQDDAGIDGVLLIGSPGATGFNAVGTVLSGAVNPSGRTADIWARDFTKDPTFVNFGAFLYSNLAPSYTSSALSSVASNATVTTDAPFVNYQEGIYVGYRYYETAAAEGVINYSDAVVYPFGYGLSYTTFSQRITSSELGESDGNISVTVEVTNTGSAPGKDVVQLYYSAPYTKGGIEKSSIVLADFAKTEELAPGQSATITLSFPVEDMASYDYKNAGAYVLEKGDYRITLQADSHTVVEGASPVIYSVPDTVVFDEATPRASDQEAATNRFDDVSGQFVDSATAGKILNMSRADFKGTFPTAPTEDLLQASQAATDGFAQYDAQAAAQASEVEMPTTGASTELTLIDLRGKPYDDPQWEELLDSLTVDEMTSMLLNGAYNTEAIPSIAKPQTLDPDGPAGFSSFINSSINGTAYTSEVTLAQTWNTDMAYQMGLMLGNEAIYKGINGWYAPAVNLHRSPFAGRNFEYYSEDPLLSGDMAAAAANGVAQKGVYSTIKHFALNDQETNRVNNGIAVWANEQAIREIYLRPFEIAVKNVTMPVSYIADDTGTLQETSVGATAMMSSFNRIGGTWAGGSKALMDDILRKEWGFKGFAITDFNLYDYMSPDQAIAAGTDLTLSFAPSKSFADTSSAYAVSNIRQATKNILYTVANSNAMVGMAPGASVSYSPPMWKYIQYGVSALLLLVIIAAGVRVYRRSKELSE